MHGGGWRLARGVNRRLGGRSSKIERAKRERSRYPRPSSGRPALEALPWVSQLLNLVVQAVREAKARNATDMDKHVLQAYKALAPLIPGLPGPEL